MYLVLYTGWAQRNDPTCFLSELHQIFIKFANFWRMNGQNNKIMWVILIFHLT